jgi:hypothetical protein
MMSYTSCSDWGFQLGLTNINRTHRMEELDVYLKRNQRQVRTHAIPAPIPCGRDRFGRAPLSLNFHPS